MWVTMIHWKCMFIVCLTIVKLQSCTSRSGWSELRESACLLCVSLFSLQTCLHFSMWVTWKCMLRESACLLCVWLFSFQSFLQFSLWVTWKCMFIVCLTIFSSILSPLQSVSYVKVHAYCVFDYFLFNLVSSAGELRKSACLLCVWLFSLQSCLHFSRWDMWKCMFIVCLNIFSSILPPLQDVSYVKVHVYCVFDYSLFNLASNSVCKLRESACLLCVWLFSLQSCLHFRLCVTWKCMFIVYLTIFTTSDRDELFAFV